METHYDIKRRRRLLPHETSFLISIFEQYPRPSQAMRQMVANKLNMSPRTVQIWFQNRRAKVKRDILESASHGSFLFTPHQQQQHQLFLDLFRPAPSRQFGQPAISGDSHSSNSSSGTLSPLNDFLTTDIIPDLDLCEFIDQSVLFGDTINDYFSSLYNNDTGN